MSSKREGRGPRESVQRFGRGGGGRGSEGSGGNSSLSAMSGMGERELPVLTFRFGKDEVLVWGSGVLLCNSCPKVVELFGMFLP